MKRIKNIVANAKVTIAFFFIILRFVIMRDVKTVRNIIIRKIVPKEVVKDFGKINVGLG